MYKHEEELIDKVARILGWIDYPEDSIEHGVYWHLDANKAPFGPRIIKEAWNPLFSPYDAHILAVDQNISTIYGYCLDDAPIVTCYGIHGPEFGVKIPCFPSSLKETARCIMMAIVHQHEEVEKIMNGETE